MSIARTRPVLPVLLAVLAAATAMALAPVHTEAAQLQQGPDVERARTLEAEAHAELAREDVTRWKSAADLFREAASYREDADAEKVDDLRMAARLAFYARREQQATDDAEAAARLALRRGDLLTAAHGYLDAAWMAAEANQPNRSRELIGEARLLAQSPLLAQSVRSDLLGRIQDAA
ncbi:MAG: hypothetical protein ACOC5J_01580 [Gemmatimonadota bacterium]